MVRDFTTCLGGVASSKGTQRFAVGLFHDPFLQIVASLVGASKFVVRSVCFVLSQRAKEVRVLNSQTRWVHSIRGA